MISLLVPYSDQRRKKTSLTHAEHQNVLKTEQQLVVEYLEHRRPEPEKPHRSEMSGEYQLIMSAPRSERRKSQQQEQEQTLPLANLASCAKIYSTGDARAREIKRRRDCGVMRYLDSDQSGLASRIIKPRKEEQANVHRTLTLVVLVPHARPFA